MTRIDENRPPITAITLLMLGALLLGVLAATALPAAETPQADASWTGPHFCGFRGDGNGHYRDCTPVTRWSAGDFYQLREKAKGKDGKTAWQTTTVPAKVENLVWQKEMPAWSNANLVMAQGRLFALTEFTRETTCGALTCLDPATGEVLWSTELITYDLLPRAQAEEVRQAFLRRNKHWFEYDDLRGRVEKALGTNKRDEVTDELVKERVSEADQAAMAAEGFPLFGERGGFRNYVGGLYEIDRHKTRTFNEATEILDRYGYGDIESWLVCTNEFSCGAGVGMYPATPCTDGERIYATSGLNEVFCLDLEGKILWKKKYPMVAHSIRASQFPSPTLCDGKLIYYHEQSYATSKRIGKKADEAISVRVFDKLTGEELWTAPRHTYGDTQHFLASPVVATVDGVRLLIVADGRIFRLDDGTLLYDGYLGYAGHGRPLTVVGDIVVSISGADGGAYAGPKSIPGKYGFGYRLGWADAGKTKLSVKEIWRLKDYYNASVFVDGLLYISGRDGIAAVDIETGEIKGKHPSKQAQSAGTNQAGILVPGPKAGRYEVTAFHTMDAAGGYLFMRNGYCKSDWAVYTATPKLELVSLMKHTGPGGGMYGSYTFFSGNRVFYWCGNVIYCMGNPQEPMRLSEHHRPF